MRFFQRVVISMMVFTLVGCVETTSTKVYTIKTSITKNVDIDLIIAKAKAEERARVLAELANQAKQAEQNEKIVSQDQCVTVDSPVAANEKALEPLELSELGVALKPSIDESSTLRVQSMEKTSEQVAEQTIEHSIETVVKSVVEPLVETVSTPSTTENVIRHCHVFQLIPKEYKGSLPAVLNKSTEIRGNTQLLPTLCKYSRTPEIIKNLQLALQAQGYLKSNGAYDLVVIDGVWGINTLSAVRAYQKDRGLAYGQLSIEVLRDLHVSGFTPLSDKPL